MFLFPPFSLVVAFFSGCIFCLVVCFFIWLLLVCIVDGLSWFYDFCILVCLYVFLSDDHRIRGPIVPQLILNGGKDEKWYNSAESVILLTLFVLMLAVAAGWKGL